MPGRLGRGRSDDLVNEGHIRYGDRFEAARIEDIARSYPPDALPDIEAVIHTPSGPLAGQRSEIQRYTLFPIPTPVSDSHLTTFSALRLLSLHTDTSRFCSTYARESVFTPDIWRSRLDDDDKVTFIVSTRSSLPPYGDEGTREEEWVVMMNILGPAVLRNIPHDTPVDISHAGRKGLRSQLLRAGFDHVEKYQVGEIGDADTSKMNEDARRLYTKEKFTEAGEWTRCQGGGSVWMVKAFQ
ncbi:hypothetical protein JAAARDRAFT_76486 [Jaapia argillacea MUCL 33604]|uniref:Uncharacterized protein n=1 Tax=Jaapia argillacea MUCL 33604 TaxID=933084 RepID=A0A067Q6Z4_9AGAM|nr:hypothetical protein JAAARDRAFT_76486 [Jaapia argillacea MUCL 33604]